jgi:hypothetical protein
MLRKIMLRFAIRTINKWFSDGLRRITDYEGNLIAYQWTWSKEINDLYGKKRRKAY